ncbi:MAG: GNAT family N-acetyltransferase [Planctomycetota bacterium]
MSATTTMVLRAEPQASDREAIRRLVTSTGVFSPIEIDVAVELLDERLGKGPTSGYDFLFAEHDGEVVGYACFGAIALTQGSFDLYWIAVDKRLHGQGIGRLLLGRSEQEIARQGGRRVYIETSGRVPYEPTRAFYLRCGYEAEAILKDFYAPGDDKYIFSKAV